MTDLRRPAPVVPGSLGVLGGTFDPIHIGHLALAEEAAEAVGLERVVFVPAARPPHKPGVEFAPAADRVAMVELAIADNPRFEASRIELDRPGPSYMADTLAELARAHGTATYGGARSRGLAGAESQPGGAGDQRDGAGSGEVPPSSSAAGLHLILSADAFAGLPTWHDPRRVLSLARLVVAPRHGFRDASPASLAAWFPGFADTLAPPVFLDAPRLHLSATALRERVAAGRSVRYLVPDAVLGYIEDHGLYRALRRNP